MTCDVRLQLAEVQCVVARCDVHAEPVLVVRAVYFKACEVRPHIANYFGNNERTDDCYLLSFGVSYDFVAQKWRILAIFHKKNHFFGN